MENITYKLSITRTFKQGEDVITKGITEQECDGTQNPITICFDGYQSLKAKGWITNVLVPLDSNDPKVAHEVANYYLKHPQKLAKVLHHYDSGMSALRSAHRGY